MDAHYFKENKIIFPIELQTNSAYETLSFAESFGRNLSPFCFVALFGGLGVGKTAFVRGAAKSFGVDHMVCSPTFSIVNEYLYEKNKKIIHFDVYRISTEQDLYEIGYFDILKDKSAIIFVEWSENITCFLPQQYIKVDITMVDVSRRNIKITLEKN